MVKEINVDLSWMHLTKAWRSDGMPISPLPTILVLNQSQIPSASNHSFVRLIIKKKQPSQVADSYPISLCTFLYKLISKVIANKL